MEFLNHIKAFVYLLCGGLVFCIGCSNSEQSGKKYRIAVDSTHTKVGIQDMYDYERIVEGIWFVRTNNGHTYACGLKDYHTVALRNLDVLLDTMDIILKDSIHSFIAKEGVIYCVSDNKHKITVLNFSGTDNLNPVIDSIVFPPVFNETVFNAANLHGPVVVRSEGDLLIPYNCNNNSPNMLDTYTYQHIYGRTVSSEKLIRPPKELTTSYQFLNQVIGTFSGTGDKLFYMFESIPKLYCYDMLSKHVDSVRIPEFRISEYAADKQGDFTYLRNYLADNDANRRLLYDANILYLVKRNAESNPSKYTIFCFDTSLRLLTHIDVPYKLNTEVVFINDHKLYIYAHKSNNKFYTFSVVE